MPDPVIYPPVSRLLPLEAIPNNLGFVKGAVEDVFGRIFFRDLQVQKSREGDVGFYKLVLVLYDRLAFEIPGTGGVTLVLFPAPDSGTTTDIPVALSYRWDVLKYVHGFSHASLNELPRLLFDAFVEIAGVDAPSLLEELIRKFYGFATDPVQAFVDSYNLDKFPAVVLIKLNDPDPVAVIEDLLTQLEDVQEADVYELLFGQLFEAAATVEEAFEQITAFFSEWVRELTVEDFKKLLIPHASVELAELTLALEFPRTLLKPVKPNGDVIDEAPSIPEPDKQKSRLTFNAGMLRYSTDTGFEFDSLAEFDFSKSQIGNTGITLEFDDMKLDLSRTKNIPEATADGRPVDFVGAYVKKATIGLPKKWFNDTNTTPQGPQPSIVGTNLIIGTGGFSGKIGFDSAGMLHKKLGNFEAELTSFDLKFERNAIVESNIAGKLVVKGFKDSTGQDAKIEIKAHIAEDGDFSVTATEKDGIDVEIPGVLKFRIYTLGFGREDNRFFLTTSGRITLTFNIPSLTFDRPIAVELKKLIIWQDGSFEIEGGTIILPQALTLKIGPVKLSVTAISMGSYERNGHKYKYFGFDGGVNVNPGGVDVRASGVKVYWRTDGPPLDIFVRVEGIAIDLIIPGSKSADEATVLISGFLQVKEPSGGNSTAGTEYAGGISFKLPKAGIGGTAAMRLNPSIPAFIIDTELSISVPIPLGNTSLGIYGFRGLIGMRYVADRTAIGLAADADWYQYYKKKVQLLYKEGVNIDKFAQRKGFAIGAGLTLGTLTDSGKAFSAKLFLLLSLPDALLLQGQAAIMAERVDLSPNDPPFSAFIAITKQSVEAAFGVNYKLPADSGAILDLQALVEMGFFFNDASAWYINAGRDLPESKRVTARLFTLFNAWSYLMLSSSGIKAGAGVTWDFQKGFGPIRIEAHAYLATHGRVAFKHVQIGAAILLGGSAAVRVFKFKLGLSIAAALAAEAPKPFIVTGSVAVSIDLPWPFSKLGGTFTLDFTWTFSNTLNTAAVPIFNEDNLGEVAKAVNVATRERFDLNIPAGSAFTANALPPPVSSGWARTFDDFVIPLDATIDIEFKKPIAPAPAVTNIGITGSGFSNSELIPPQKGKSPQVQHQYVVDEVKIRSWNPAAQQWNDYDVYSALTPLQHAPFIDAGDLAGLKQGWWQVDQPGRVNKLSLLSQTPLTYANDVAGPFVPENSGITDETIFCTAEPINEQCLVVDDFPDLVTLTAGRRYSWNGVDVRVTDKDGRVVSFVNPFGLTNGIALNADSTLEIFFPEDAGRVRLRLATLADNVTVRYQRRQQTGIDGSHQPMYEYVTVQQSVLNAANLLQPLTYESKTGPIHKVVIVAGRCACLDGATAIPVPVIALGSAWPEAPAGGQIEGAPVRRCGTVEAYFGSVCDDAQAQFDALQHQYEQLIAEAKENELLAHSLETNRCDPTLPTKYEEAADALNEQAEALQPQIEHLSELVECCRNRRRTGSDPGPVVIEPFPVTRDCNIDPTFDYRCLSVFFGLCWLPLREQIFNSTIPSFSSLLANNNAMVKAINNTIHPIWRPDTTYAITIRTTDKVDVPPRSISTSTVRYMHLGFRTKGPVGHFHPHRAEYLALAAQDRADQYRLQSLKPYIDFSKSYPNALGNVLGAKPLFYVNPKLQLFYIHAYVYTMFGGQFDLYNGSVAVTSSIEVSIHDPVDPIPAAPADPGFVPPVSHAFAANESGHSTFDVQLLNNLATQGQPCTGTGHQNGIAPMGIQSNVTVERLKPLKLYLAVFKSNFGGIRSEVHRYNFQTSRYADFAEQVNSYKLKDKDGAYVKDAVFDDIAVPLDATQTAQFTALVNHTWPAGDPLDQEYADPFDRLMEGVLRVGAIDPPAGTDFNIVRDAGTGKAIGILVRSPEPFNDPGIPAAEINDTILLAQLSTPAKTFGVVYSKDLSKAFIGDATLDLAPEKLAFTFSYLEYDGASYVPASVVTVTLFA